MLDNLMNSIKGEVLGSLTEKAGISTEQAEQVLPIAQESIQSGLMEQVTSGNVDGILGMFNSSGDSLMNNSIFDGIKQTFMNSIMSKLGLSGPIATMVANVGLGKIMESISGKAKDSSGSVTQDGLMSLIGMGGGDGGGIADIAKGMLGDKLGGLGKNLF